MKKKDKEILLDELLNCLFDDHEGSIEHVDMSYRAFKKKLIQLADL